MTDAVLKGSEAAIAKGSKSFAAAARIFDAETRQDCVMLYAWCRHCDDVIDGQSLGQDQAPGFRDGQMARLQELRRLTALALAGEPSADPVFEALRRVVARRAIPAIHPQELLDGFAMDVAGRDYRRVADLLDYAYHVAGVVGVMMARIMQVSDPEVLDRASDLGIGFQLTNIARDVIEDARAGRVYLPADLLAAEGLATVEPERREDWPALHRVALRLLDIAEGYYDSAMAGMGALPPRSALAIGAARRVYRAIGTDLRRKGPAAWETRLSTGPLRKMALIAAATGDVAASRWRVPGPRTGLYTRPGASSSSSSSSDTGR